MGEAFRNPELLPVLSAQHDRLPAAERRRAAADVDGDVVHLAFQHRYQFSLGPRPLVMQPAQYTSAGGGHIALHEAIRQAQCSKALGVPGLVEETTLITENRRFDHPATRQ
ncbi:hypothetical protein D3C71_1711690 [compost metagenome]